MKPWNPPCPPAPEFVRLQPSPADRICPPRQLLSSQRPPSPSADPSNAPLNKRKTKAYPEVTGSQLHLRTDGTLPANTRRNAVETPQQAIPGRGKNRCGSILHAA